MVILSRIRRQVRPLLPQHAAQPRSMQPSVCLWPCSSPSVSGPAGACAPRAGRQLAEHAGGRARQHGPTAARQRSRGVPPHQLRQVLQPEPDHLGGAHSRVIKPGFLHDVSSSQACSRSAVAVAGVQPASRSSAGWAGAARLQLVEVGPQDQGRHVGGRAARQRAQRHVHRRAQRAWMTSISRYLGRPRHCLSPAVPSLAAQQSVQCASEAQWVHSATSPLRQVRRERGGRPCFVMCLPRPAQTAAPWGSALVARSSSGEAAHFANVSGSAERPAVSQP